MLPDVSRPVDPAVRPGQNISNLIHASLYRGCEKCLAEIIWQFCLETLAGSNKKVLNARDLVGSALHTGETVDRNLTNGNPLWRSFPGQDSDQFEFMKSCQVYGTACH